MPTRRRRRWFRRNWRRIRRVGKAQACPPSSSMSPMDGGHGASAPLPTVRRRARDLARRASRLRYSEIVSSPQIKNISLYPKREQGHISRHPVPPEGRRPSSRTRDGLRWTWRCLDDRHRSVRQRRVVLTSRCWRQVLKKLTLLRGDGGKRAVLRGEHVISRKAIAQGMSDVLRCPVCSCAHFLCTLRMRPRVQRASGIPCAL